MDSDLLKEMIAETPSLGIAGLLCWLFYKAVVHFLEALKNRDEVISAISQEHVKSFEANTEVLRDNSQIIGECTSVMRDCRDEIKEMNRRGAI